jgi:hypothetical protein
VLGLVADDHLEQRAIPGAGAVEHLQRPPPHGGDVAEDVLAAQEGNVAAGGARGLEGVVEVGEVGAQERLAAVAVHEPEVLVGGDVAEIPVQRAHERVLDALQLDVRERRHEGQRALAGVLQGVAER